MKIRTATASDRDAIRAVNMAAFPEEERELIGDLAVNLLTEESDPPILTLIAEIDDALVGHIAFSPLKDEDAPDWRGYILAPLAVNPDKQRTGIGTQLIREGTRRLEEMGVPLLIVYGDPAYYGRFGFRAEAAEPYDAPYPLLYPFGWQAMTLGGASPPAPCKRIQCVRALCDPKLW